MTSSQHDKLALVTGGMGGIGKAISLALVAKGYRVVATVAAPIENYESPNDKITLVEVDVASFDSCAAMADKVKAEHGTPHVLVNNAGVTRDGVFKRMSVEQWRDVMAVNVDGLFNITRQFVNEMIETKNGRIINISSINGQKGQFGQVNYSASKAAVHGFTMALAQELATSNITVNTISPGYTATPMVTAIREDVLEKIIAGIPMRRLAEVGEIAALVCYLCSDEAAFMSGANLPINGVQFTSF